MQEHFTSIREFRESPQRILLPTRESSVLFIAALAITLVLSVVSFFFTSVLL